MNKHIKISEPVLYYDKKNLNNRIYSKKCAENIVEQFNERKNSFYGELGHPERREILLNNVSHKIIELYLNEENQTIEGTFELLDTKNGNLIKDVLLNNKFNDMFCIRPRGIGNINENGEVEKYSLYTFDIIPKEIDAFKNITNKTNE